VPRLVLLNGPPGVGKSTLARRYVADRPLTLALEIDTLRAMLGAWLEHSDESGPLARRLALAVAAAHLREERDVVVPQLLTRRDFVDALRATAEANGATFHEVTLMDDREAVLERARRRHEPEGGFSARALAAKQGHSHDESYDLFVDALRKRPEAPVIRAASPEQAYAELVRLLG
jgi:chloramphenicol 3-O-phosphotransferase